MKSILVEDIIKQTNGKLIIGNNKSICKKVTTDTRKIEQGDTYVGIKGENFNGNELWEEALNLGANIVIIDGIDFNDKDLEQYKDKVIILVEDTIKALGDIARYKRSLYNIPVIAVTGSVGKTSTKDIIANVVSKQYKTLKTQGNFNNHIGVPLTLLQLEDHEAAVIEMGMNHKGEMSYLTSIVKPTIAVITNIGTSHIGNLGSRQNILKAKLEVLEGMDKKVLVLNNDNDLLHEYKEENKQNIWISTFGIENKSNIMAKDIKLNKNNSEFICNTQEETKNIVVPVGGEHFVYNALCAVTVGKILKIDIEKIKDGIESFELTKKRMEIISLKNGAKIINDSYNASYESMKAAIKYLTEFESCRKIAVLGDMLELGKFSKQLHEKVGKEVEKYKIDILVCIGNEAKYIVKGAIEAKKSKDTIKYFENKDDAYEYINNIIREKDILLFKASNGMKFYDLVDKLKK